MLMMTDDDGDLVSMLLLLLHNDYDDDLVNMTLLLLLLLNAHDDDLANKMLLLQLLYDAAADSPCCYRCAANTFKAVKTLRPTKLCSATVTYIVTPLAACCCCQTGPWHNTRQPSSRIE